MSVPLEIQIPALKIKAPVLGVGLTLTNAMASPIGMFPDDPIWQSVFWYRGGVIPGDVGTATFAGHFDDALGRPAVFAFLGDLGIGDLIVVQDKRSGLMFPLSSPRRRPTLIRKLAIQPCLPESLVLALPALPKRSPSLIMLRT